MMALCDTAREIFLGTLQKLELQKVVRRHVRCAAGVLSVGASTFALSEFRRVVVVSLGKAAVPMAAAFVTSVRPEMTRQQVLEGIVVGPNVAEDAEANLRYFVGGHPLPDEQSLLAGEAVLELTEGCGEDCLVFFLISGGASTMIEKALDATLTLEEISAFHKALVHSGMGIQEMNALRKHFSALKGGRMAVAASRAMKCTLLVSDVPGDALSTIGSGPTLPDPSTVADCRAILASRHESLRLSAKVAKFFADDALLETPKEDHIAFRSASTVVLLSSADLCAAASDAARDLGFHVVIDNTCDEWAYDDAARYLLGRVAELRRSHEKVCVLSAGEISVQVSGRHGVGGRNQHFVLECARQIAQSEAAVTVLSAGSDGIDGNSRAAGATADETTVARAVMQGMDVEAALAQFDSSSLLDALGDTIVTGPSGNNVRDLRILLATA